MKRSTQVSLLVMTAVGIGGAAYALAATGSLPASRSQSAVASDATQNCRSTSNRSSGSGHGSSWFSRSGLVLELWSRGTSTSSSEFSGTARGGFGSIGHAFASLGG